MSTVERWNAERAALLAASEALGQIAKTESPPTRDVLMQTRWQVARSLLCYLSTTDRTVFARLRNHADPRARDVASRFAGETETIYAMFDTHLRHWTAGAAEAAWPAYCAGVRLQVTVLRNRLRRETAELLPFLSSAPDGSPLRSANDRNWAGDQYRFRDMLGMSDENAPILRSA